MWPATALLADLGLSMPVLQAPMGDGVGGPDLAAAIGRAGGLGCITADGMSPEALTDAVDAFRARTEAPLHIHLSVPGRCEGASVDAAHAALAPFRADLDLPDGPPPTAAVPDLRDRVDAVRGARPEVISLTGGPPDDGLLTALRGTGALILGVATTVGEALILEDTRAVDVIVAQGAAAGGPRGSFAVPADHGLVDTLALVQGIRAKARRPVIAAGGLMTGAGVRAVLALGTVGAMLGTAFLGADESGAERGDVDAAATARDDGTAVTRAWTGWPGRAVRTRFVLEMADGGAPVAPWPAQAALTAPIRAAAARRGEPGLRALWAGQGAAMIRRAPVRAILERLETEAEGVSHT